MADSVTTPAGEDRPQEMRAEALTRSRVDHWLRNRNLVLHHAGMNKSLGYGGTIEALMTLLEDLGEYARAEANRG